MRRRWFRLLSAAVLVAKDVVDHLLEVLHVGLHCSHVVYGVLGGFEGCAECLWMWMGARQFEEGVGSREFALAQSCGRAMYEWRRR